MRQGGRGRAGGGFPAGLHHHRRAVLWAPQIWAFKGSCSEFGYKFRAKLKEMRQEQKDAKYEDVLEAVGAGKGSMNELLTSLIEVGEKQK